MALKPVPKAILIALVVGAVGFGLTKALPLMHKPAEQTVEAQEAPIKITTPLPADSTDNAAQASEKAARAVQAARQAAANTSTDAGPTPVREEAPATTTNGGKGMDELLKAGRK